MERDDILNIAQKVLDLPALDIYWHTEVEGRKPLIIMANELMKSKPALFKFGEQVIYGGEELLNDKKVFFEFKSILITDNHADVKFAYAVEGIVGEAQLEKDGIVWKVIDCSVSEK